MQLLKFKKKTNSKVEQAKVLIGIFCLLTNTKLSDMEITVLAYFMVYRVTKKTKELILASGILSNENSLKTSLSKLKRKGMLLRDEDTKEYILRKELDFPLQSITGVVIKVDNT